MSTFLHFTVVVEYQGRLSGDVQNKIANQIEESLVRHADTVAVHRAFEANAPRAKVKVLPISELPTMRDRQGSHQHDNDSACTPCVRLYEFVHEDTL